MLAPRAAGRHLPGVAVTSRRPPRTPTQVGGQAFAAAPAGRPAEAAGQLWGSWTHRESTTTLGSQRLGAAGVPGSGRPCAPVALAATPGSDPELRAARQREERGLQAFPSHSARLTNERLAPVAPSQWEAGSHVSGTEGRREKGSPGVKLKLNFVSYKVVTGGRFWFPIRNNTGSLASTEEEDFKTISPIPKPASSSFGRTPPIHEQEKGVGECSGSLIVGRGEVAGVAYLDRWHECN